MGNYEANKFYVLKGSTIEELEKKAERNKPVAGKNCTVTPVGNDGGYTIDFDPDSTSKSAIVPVADAWIGWFCEERPEVVFADVVDVEMDQLDPDGSLSGTWHAPKDWLESVEPETLMVTSAMPIGAPAARVEVLHPAHGGVINVYAEPARDGRRCAAVRLRIEAVRKGFAGIRWPRYSEAIATANARFWAEARQVSPEAAES